MTRAESAQAPGTAAALAAWVRAEFADPRAWQIAALGTLLAWNISQLSMGAALLPSLVAIVATVASQAAASWILTRCDEVLHSPASPPWHAYEFARRGSAPSLPVPGGEARDPDATSHPEMRACHGASRGRTSAPRSEQVGSCSRLTRHDLRSPLITGLSLALLLRGDALWVPAVAGGVAVASKFLIRVGGKHLFNPAAFAILTLILSGHAWVSPGQWGQSTLLVSGMVFLAILVLSRATRLDTALAFLGAHAVLLVARAIRLGDPMTIPLHQLQNGALLLFAFFMITDPKTTPAARPARILFAVAVAGLAHWLAASEQMRPALYVALVATSLTVPILDKIFPAKPFIWHPTKEGKP